MDDDALARIRRVYEAEPVKRSPTRSVDPTTERMLAYEAEIANLVETVDALRAENRRLNKRLQDALAENSLSASLVRAQQRVTMKNGKVRASDPGVSRPPALIAMQSGIFHLSREPMGYNSEADIVHLFWASSDVRPRADEIKTLREWRVRQYRDVGFPSPYETALELADMRRHEGVRLNYVEPEANSDRNTAGVVARILRPGNDPLSEAEIELTRTLRGHVHARHGAWPVDSMTRALFRDARRVLAEAAHAEDWPEMDPILPEDVVDPTPPPRPAIERLDTFTSSNEPGRIRIHVNLCLREEGRMPVIATEIAMLVQWRFSRRQHGCYPSWNATCEHLMDVRRLGE